MCLEIVVIFLALQKELYCMGTSSGIMGIIYELKKKCSQVDQKLMDELKISQSELQFFSALDNCQGISSPELAKNMALSLSRISRVVDKLVINGYLDRKTDDLARRTTTAATVMKTAKLAAIRSLPDQGPREAGEMCRIPGSTAAEARIASMRACLDVLPIAGASEPAMER